MLCPLCRTPLSVSNDGANAACPQDLSEFRVLFSRNAAATTNATGSAPAIVSGLTIKANTLMRQRYLEIHSGSVIYCDAVALGGQQTFTYLQIECVLLSQDQVLSFQVGSEMFSLPLRLDKPAHRAALEVFVASVKRSLEPTAPIMPQYPSARQV